MKVPKLKHRAGGEGKQHDIRVRLSDCSSGGRGFHGFDISAPARSKVHISILSVNHLDFQCASIPVVTRVYLRGTCRDANMAPPSLMASLSVDDKYALREILHRKLKNIPASTLPPFRPPPGLSQASRNRDSDEFDDESKSLTTTNVVDQVLNAVNLPQ